MNDAYDNSKDDAEMLKQLSRAALGDRAPWPEVAMAMAVAAASRSRDMTTRVGAVVLTAKWRVLGTGYNGPPARSPESIAMSGPPRHLWVVHAEENALLQAVATLSSNFLVGCRLFSTHRPCVRCLRMAYHLGIDEIVYLIDELNNDQRHDAMELVDALSGQNARIRLPYALNSPSRARVEALYGMSISLAEPKQTERFFYDSNHCEICAPQEKRLQFYRCDLHR